MAKIRNSWILAQEGRIRLRCAALPLIPHFGQKRNFTKAVSPPSFHKLATFKPNLPCNDSHLMFFQKQQQNMRVHEEKIEDAHRRFLLLSSHLGLCLCDQIKQWEWWWLLLSLAAPLQHNLAMINTSVVFLLSPGQPIPWDSRTRCGSRSGSAPASSSWGSTAQERPCRSLCFGFALLCIEFSREWGTGVLYALILGRIPCWSSWRWLKQGHFCSLGKLHKTELWLHIPLHVLDVNLGWDLFVSACVSSLEPAGPFPVAL